MSEQNDVGGVDGNEVARITNRINAMFGLLDMKPADDVHESICILYGEMASLRHQLAFPAAVSGWISVSERLPDDGVSFLAVLECGGEQTICTMRLPVLMAKNAQPCGDFIRERVTHWQPLPSPPAIASQEVGHE